MKLQKPNTNRSKQTKSERIEILAPGGNMNMVRSAVFSGADSVYLGVKGFNARSSAENFDEETLKDAVSFAHQRNCKVYAALNTIVFPGEEQALEEVVADVAEAGVDGLIITDLGAIRIVSQMVPDLPLHASTQLSVHSLAGLRQLSDMGFQRAVLARELSLNEIEKLADASPIELEVFIHGALCFSVSGQCYISAFLGGQSANRGTCAGTCRFNFSTKEGQRRPDPNSHDLSMADLSGLKYLPALEAMGICAAKIEGRMRGAAYCAVAVTNARLARDGFEYDEKGLYEVFNRGGFTSSFLDGEINDRKLFGTTTTAYQSKEEISKAHALVRREMARVEIDLSLTIEKDKVSLSVTDCDGNTLEKTRQVQSALSEDEPGNEAHLRLVLSKLGSTPFKLRDLELNLNGFFVPQSLVAELRREISDELLKVREVSKPYEVFAFQRTKASEPTDSAPQKLKAFIPNPHQNLNAEGLDEAIVPIQNFEFVAPSLIPKVRLSLPRLIFNEKPVYQLIEKTQSLGFTHYEAQNIAHFKMLSGLDFSSGFGLNAANHYSVEEALLLGASSVTLSPELSFKQVQVLADDFDPKTLNLIVYGYFPLMISRACPLKRSCKGCNRTGQLVGVKHDAMKILCDRVSRTVLNAYPLWLLDKTYRPNPVLYFTTESHSEIEETIKAARSRAKAPGAFTRGLYFKRT
jgi:putative protease